MNCKSVKENLVGLIEKTLPGDRARETEAHLESCESCRELVRDFAQLWLELETPERIVPSPQFWFQLERRWRGRERKSTRAAPTLFGWAYWLRPALAVTVLLVCVLAGTYLGGLFALGDIASSEQQAGTESQDLFDYYLNGLDDYPAGSVGDSYSNSGASS